MVIINEFHGTSLRSNLSGYASLEDLEYAAYLGSPNAIAKLNRIERDLCPHKKNGCHCIITETEVDVADYVV